MDLRLSAVDMDDQSHTGIVAETKDKHRNEVLESYSYTL